MLFENGDRIVFAGDSVTDVGSANPVGEGLGDNLGRGYVRIIENMLCSVYPERFIRVTNSGISGNTSRHLAARWERDVVNLEPQWVSICIGINDVWRQFDAPAIRTWVDLPEYESNLRAMLEAVKGKVKGVFLMSPYYMEPLKEDPMRRRMDEYTAVCRRLAGEYGAIFVDLQAMFDRYFAYRHSTFIAYDRVHPNLIGATLIAREFLSAAGFDYNHIPEEI